jgi:glycine hydroxymethyltransferase
MRDAEMRTIAGWITQVLSKPDDAVRATRIRGEVMALCQQFPAPTGG